MLAVALAFSLFLSPAQGEPPAQAAPEVTASPDAPLEAWATALVAAVTAGEQDEFVELVDVDAITRAATQGVDVPKLFAEGYAVGAREGMLSENGFYARMRRAAAEGHFDFLRIRSSAGGPTALMRIVDAKGTFDYFEFDLVRTEDGVRATDIYVFGAGERMSETMRRWFVQHAMSQNRGLVDRLLGRDQALAKHWKTVRRILEGGQQEKPDDVEKAYDELPEELQRDKTVLLLLLSAYPGDDQRYRAALDALLVHFPDDPCAQLHRIDACWLAGEHEGAIEALEELDDLVDGDPYLDHLTATLLASIESWERATKHARAAIDDGLGWIDPYWTLVTCAIGESEHRRVLEVLIEIDMTFQVEWADFTTQEAYAEFVESNEHAAWLEYLRTKPQPPK